MGISKLNTGGLYRHQLLRIMLFSVAARLLFGMSRPPSFNIRRRSYISDPLRLGENGDARELNSKSVYFRLRIRIVGRKDRVAPGCRDDYFIFNPMGQPQPTTERKATPCRAWYGLKSRRTTSNMPSVFTVHCSAGKSKSFPGRWNIGTSTPASMTKTRDGGLMKRQHPQQDDHQLRRRAVGGPIHRESPETRRQGPHAQDGGASIGLLRRLPGH